MMDRDKIPFGFDFGLRRGRPATGASVLSRLVSLALPCWPELLSSCALMLVATGIWLSVPLVVRVAVDSAFRTRDASVLDGYVAGLFALIALMGASSLARFLIISHAGGRIVADLRSSLFAHLQRLPVAFYDRTRTGDLASLLSNDVGLLQRALTDELVRLAGQLATIGGGLALALVIDWKMTATVIVLLTGVLAAFMACGHRLRKLNRAALDSLSEAVGAATESLGDIRLVKAFTREDSQDAVVRQKLTRHRRLTFRAGALEGTLDTLAVLALAGILIGVLWYGGRGVLRGSLTPGSLIAFLMTMTILSGPLATLSLLHSRFQQSMGAAERLFAILDEPGESPDSPDAEPFPEGPARISLVDVAFRYPAGEPVLRGLSLEIPAGRGTALVGHSGAGKSTIAHLLYRFYEPQAGILAIDGVPIDRIARRSLREQIGIVPQEPTLFCASLRDNIRFGRLEATDVEVEAAAVAANVDGFARQLPDGYDTLIGERGITLSGGQRQRVAIARALLKNPRILILDEATSALDNQSEGLVHEALDRLMRGRTTIVIAHRLSTIRSADVIAVLSGGRIAEHGSHESLLDAAGEYARLYVE